MDPRIQIRIRIHTKMSWIRNTNLLEFIICVAQCAHSIFEETEFCARPGIKIRFVRDWCVAAVWIYTCTCQDPLDCQCVHCPAAHTKKESSRGKKTAKKVTLVALEGEKKTKKTRI
jgi:hypothetical protein